MTSYMKNHTYKYSASKSSPLSYCSAIDRVAKKFRGSQSKHKVSFIALKVVTFCSSDEPSSVVPHDLETSV